MSIVSQVTIIELSCSNILPTGRPSPTYSPIAPPSRSVPIGTSLIAPRLIPRSVPIALTNYYTYSPDSGHPFQEEEVDRERGYQPFRNVESLIIITYILHDLLTFISPTGYFIKGSMPSPRSMEDLGVGSADRVVSSPARLLLLLFY